MLENLQRQCISYFLCQYDPRSKKKRTKDVVREMLLFDYSSERVEEFLDQRLSLLETNLVEEFNERFGKKWPIRYQIVDDTGTGKMVQGYIAPETKSQIAFQNALHRLSATEFERLAAVILMKLGCYEAFYTPTSHDQGVDAFGHQKIVKPTPYGTTHQLTWIAQAKFYLSTQVSTGDIRELVGSRELLLAKIFSTVDERYKELRLRHYAPTAIALVTTEEVPSTVRRLAERAGVYVFASSDLYHLIGPSLPRPTLASIKKFIKMQPIRTLS